MRIISEFHDYYDAVQAQGQDQTVVWVRKSETVKFKTHRNDEGKEYPFPKFRHGIGWLRDESVRVRQYIIGFCGKTYPVLRLSVSMDDYSYCYNIEEVDEFVRAHLSDQESREYFRTKGYGKYWKRKIPGKRKDYVEFFDECAQKQETFEHFFIEHHSPIFVATIDRWDAEMVFNAPLKEYGFYRLFDTYTAFQELAMYYGGVLGGVREHVPDVSDKDLAEAKGFNKWSFRKPPTK